MTLPGLTVTVFPTVADLLKAKLGALSPVLPSPKGCHCLEDGAAPAGGA